MTAGDSADGDDIGGYLVRCRTEIPVDHCYRHAPHTRRRIQSARILSTANARRMYILRMYLHVRTQIPACGLCHCRHRGRAATNPPGVVLCCAVFLFFVTTYRFEVHPSRGVDGAALGPAGEDLGVAALRLAVPARVVLEPRKPVLVPLIDSSQIGSIRVKHAERGNTRENTGDVKNTRPTRRERRGGRERILNVCTCVVLQRDGLVLCMICSMRRWHSCLRRLRVARNPTR